MNRTTLLLVCFSLFTIVTGIAQSYYDQLDPGKLKFTIGLGFDEVFTFKGQLPSVGMGYDSRLGKRFFLTFNILSHYRRVDDIYFDRVRNSPVADLLAIGAWGPLITEDEIRLLEEQGIKAFPLKGTIKSLAIPADVGIIYYGVNGRRHKLGVNVGFNVIYQNHNYFRDYLPIEYVQWSGTPQPIVQDIYLSVPTEFRSISPGLNMRIIYELHLKNAVLGVRVGAYDFVDFGSRLFSSSLTIHELSLFYGLKLMK